MDEIGEQKLVLNLPTDPDAERSLLSCMLISQAALEEALEKLSSDDFSRKEYALIFEGLAQLNQEGITADPITLHNKLNELGASERVSGVQILKDIMNAEGSSANVGQYIHIVEEKAKLRRIIKATEGISKRCYLAQEKTEDILADTEKEIFELVKSGASSEFVSIDRVTMDALAVISKAYHNKGTITGVATGFIDLDKKLSGLQPSDLILIAARPSMGKTAFVLNIAQHVAVRDKKTTAIFSLEMSKGQLMNRLLSLESGVEAQKIRTGSISEMEWAKLAEAAQSIGTSGLIIEDTPGISIAEMRSKCRKFKLDHNLGLVIIDYLQLMSGSGKSESHQQEISDISRSLKGLARELNVPIIALSQLSRAVEKRDDKRPIMSDLRDSGAIEQDADVVMFIYREDYYVRDLDDDKRNISEIIIAKQRNGPIGTVQLAWLPQFTKFANLEIHRHKDE